MFSNPISQLKEEEGGEDDIKHKYSIFNIEEQNRKIFCSTAIDMAMIEGRDMSKFIQVNKVCKINIGAPKMLNNICIPESFNMTISHQLFDYLHNYLCEFTALEQKFKRSYYTHKPILNVRFKDFWYTKLIRLRFGNKFN